MNEGPTGISAVSSVEEKKRQRRAMAIVTFYPMVILLIGVIVNLFVFGVEQIVVALPSEEYIQALVIAAVLLTINHTWIMTVTELTRGRFKMYATPEEWTKSGTSQKDMSEEGVRELERCHNTHRNTTENTTYFILLALVFYLISPPTLAGQVWGVGFAVARLGYTYSYLAGKDDLRGVFMSFSLLAMYGIASYITMSLFF